MPPIQPSLRGSLLTGASVLALSVSGAGAQAQSNAGPGGQTTLPTWTVWGEGGAFWTGGGSFNIPSIPGLGAPFTSFNPLAGIEGAVGFDYRWPTDPVWHFVFDFRYGRTGTASSNSSSSSSSSSTSFFTLFGFLNYTTVTHTANSSATQATEWESHLVSDFMIGRDLGVGAHNPQFQFGIRVADLHAAAQAQENSKSSSSSTTFYSGSAIAHSSQSASSSAFATWRSNFFGVGPRMAVIDSVPLAGFWSFDYGAGVAGLFGPRSFNFAMTTSTGASTSLNTSSGFFVFNADGWTALSYWFTPNVKMSGGIRADFYDSALLTYNVDTGALQGLNRLYWGPFLRLTGTF